MKENRKYDIIGDIHGYADELERLLTLLGYGNDGRGYEHPERMAIFVGDFIDRGPKIRETLQIVRAMVKRGSAFAVMGNHEYNALCYHTPAGNGDYLRPRDQKNVDTHAATLRAFEGRDDEFQDYRNWFMTLPLWLEVDGLRVAHACWDDAQIAALDEKPFLNPDLLVKSTRRGSKEFTAVEALLEGKEVKLPTGVTFTSKDGRVRKKIRVKWWLPAAGMTYHGMSFQTAEKFPNQELPREAQEALGDGYGATNLPVIVGHYWLNEQTPTVLAPNVASVDYSVVMPGGKLVAYRWDGESILQNEKFATVSRADGRY